MVCLAHVASLLGFALSLKSYLKVHHMEHLGFPIETVVIFVTVVILSLFIDHFAHRKDHEVSLTSAALWSCFWILVSIGFGGYLYYHHGIEMASLFFTGYVLEKCLSVDNLFVIMAIFSWFAIPNQFRHRVLYWGVLGAFFFRGIFVFIGASLMSISHWVDLVFAALVAYSAIMMLRSGDDEEEIEDYSNHIAYRGVRRFFPLWPRLHGHDFFISREHAKAEAKTQNIKIEGMAHKVGVVATPLFLCLAVIEISDVMFAFDSVPAVIAVSREPLIIYSAMIFAILGLRSLYFVLEALSRYLQHLEKAVIILLFFIAFKLAYSVFNDYFGWGMEISPHVSLIIVLSILAVGIIASIIWPAEDNKENESNVESASALLATEGIATPTAASDSTADQTTTGADTQISQTAASSSSEQESASTKSSPDATADAKSDVAAESDLSPKTTPASSDTSTVSAASATSATDEKPNTNA